MAGKNICGYIPLLILLLSALSFGERIKDIAQVEGNRINYLQGYGLVVGLRGTGDGKATQFTVKSLANMLQKMGIVVDPNRLTVRNVAAVIVTAKVPPYAKAGMRFDVDVASIGDARSLEGGTLVLTPLRGPDGQIYAFAQGQLIVGGYEARGRGAAQVKNVPTAGRIPNGAVLERDLPFRIDAAEVNIILDYPDFTTAKRIQDVINDRFRAPLATAVDSATVSSRTGTVVLGGSVRIGPVAVAVGSLVVKVKEKPEVVQPPPLSPGETREVPRTEVEVVEEKKRLVPLRGTTVQDLVNSLNRIGATPREIISILQAIKSAGALKAKLEVL